MPETDTEDVDAGFAGLMSGAADSAASESPRSRRPDATEDAPYGYHPDGRPRRSNGGRPRRSASREELAAEAAESETEEPRERPRDRAPDDRRNRKVVPFATKGSKTDTRPVPQFHEGQIARGINKLYRKAGKIVRVMDPVVGTAIIESTRKEDEDDVTVGEAWEELARTNIRIRRFCLALIKGGAWGQLFMAHAPILLALAMKESIRKHIPFGGIIESLAESDEDSAPGEGGLPGGMNSDDVAQAAELARAQMAKMGLNITPDMMEAAQKMFGGAGPEGSPMPPPAAFARQQPRNMSRAERRGRSLCRATDRIP